MIMQRKPVPRNDSLNSVGEETAADIGSAAERTDMAYQLGFAFDTGMSAVTLLLPALLNNSDSQTEHALQDQARCDRNGCC
jgi:hypothetical protein